MLLRADGHHGGFPRVGGGAPGLPGRMGRRWRDDEGRTPCPWSIRILEPQPRLVEPRLTPVQFLLPGLPGFLSADLSALGAVSPSCFS